MDEAVELEQAIESLLSGPSYMNGLKCSRCGDVPPFVEMFKHAAAHLIEDGWSKK